MENLNWFNYKNLKGQKSSLNYRIPNQMTEDVSYAKTWFAFLGDPLIVYSSTLDMNKTQFP